MIATSRGPPIPVDAILDRLEHVLDCLLTDLAQTLARSIGVDLPLIGPTLPEEAQCDGHVPSKPDRVSSIIPKLYLRPSADLSGRLTWSGQANLLTTQRCSFKLHFDRRDGRWMLLQRHAEARASRSLSQCARHRRTPHTIEGGFLPRWSIDQREWLDELRLREFHEGGWIIEQLQMSEGPGGHVS